MSNIRIVSAFTAARSLQFNKRISEINPRLLAARHSRFTLSQRHFSKTAPKGNGTFKLALLGTVVGAATGSVYTLYSAITDENTAKENESKPPKVIQALPDGIRITKSYDNPKDNSGLDIVLFQYQTCPFCCKVRAYLDFKGISYSVVEVDAVLRQDIKWSSIKKVPMVLIRQRDDQYVQMTDSSAIISLVASYLHDNHTDVGELAQYYPHVSYFDDNGKKRDDILNKYFLMYQDRTPKNFSKEIDESERKWRTWADDHLVHLISPNCYQTYAEALQTFEWFSKAGEWDIHFPKWERDLMVYCGAIAMWGISKMLKRRHNLSDDVRSHMYEALNKWTGELEKRQTKFMGGKQPGLSDISVFGVLSSMEGCQTFKDCLQNTKIAKWFYDVKEVVEKNRGQLHRKRIEGATTLIA